MLPTSTIWHTPCILAVRACATSSQYVLLLRRDGEAASAVLRYHLVCQHHRFALTALSGFSLTDDDLRTAYRTRSSPNDHLILAHELGAINLIHALRRPKLKSTGASSPGSDRAPLKVSYHCSSRQASTLPWPHLTELNICFQHWYTPHPSFLVRAAPLGDVLIHCWVWDGTLCEHSRAYNLTS